MKHVLYSKILIKVWTYVREGIIIMPDFHYNVWIYINIQKSVQVWNEFLNKINDTNRKVQNSKYISPTDRWTQSVCMQNDTTDDKNFKVGVIRFHPLQKIDKTVLICEFKMKKNRQR